MTDPNVPRESAEAIVAEAMACRDALTELDHCYQAEIDDVALAAAREGRPLSTDDKARRDGLRAAQAKVRAAFRELAFVTLQRLNNSADVAELRGRLATVDDRLRDDLTRLRNIARFAECSAKVADALAKLAAMAAGAVLKK